MKKLRHTGVTCPKVDSLDMKKPGSDKGTLAPELIRLSTNHYTVLPLSIMWIMKILF